MRRNRTSHVETLMMAPWWANVAICAIGNIAIWFIIPGYLKANISGSILGEMLAGGYTGAQPVLSAIFNIGILIILIGSLFHSFVLKQRWSD